MRPSIARRKIVSLALVVAALASCTDQTNPVAPPSTTQADGLFGNLLQGLSPLGPMRVVTRTAPLGDTLTASAVIGRRGGVIRIPAAGLRFVVPRNALRRPTRITVTAPAGDLVGYHFEPHGLRFRRPARVVQSVQGTELQGHLRLLRRAQGAYFTGDLLAWINPLEILNLDLLPGAGGAHVRFPIDHFSGYVIAMN